MRALIVSDTHSHCERLEMAIKKAGHFDVFIHLGDVEGDEEYINDIIKCEKHIVRGNNDFNPLLPGEDEFIIGGKRVYITHGHLHAVYRGIERLWREGSVRSADIVMYGHTHVPHCEKIDGIYVVNPGSLTYPRQLGRKATYMILELGDDGREVFELCYL